MKRVVIYILLTAFLFGTMEVVLKIAGSDMDSFQLTFLRFFLGGLCLLPFARIDIKREKIKLSPGDWLYITVLGILCIPASMLLFQLAIMRLNASTASVLICVNPLFTIIFAHFITKERFNKWGALVLSLGLIGIMFMIKPWDMQEGNTVAGAVLMIISALIFGLYTAVGKLRVGKMGTMVQTSYSFIIGSLILLVIMLFMGRPVVKGILDNWLMVAYISIFVTGIGYFCYFAAIKLSDATTGSLSFFIKPAIAPIIAVIVLGDKIMWNTYVGIALILVASYINIKVKAREHHEQIGD